MGRQMKVQSSLFSTPHIWAPNIPTIYVYIRIVNPSLSFLEYSPVWKNKRPSVVYWVGANHHLQYVYIPVGLPHAA